MKSRPMTSAPSSERIAALSEQARSLNRIEQADRFLLLAWAAFEGIEPPAWRCVAADAGGNGRELT